MPLMRCKCQRVLSYRIEQAGKVVKCPGCSALLQLPAAPVAPAAAPPLPAAAEGDRETPHPVMSCNWKTISRRSRPPFLASRAGGCAGDRVCLVRPCAPRAGAAGDRRQTAAQAAPAALAAKGRRRRKAPSGRNCPAHSCILSARTESSRCSSE